MQRYAYNHINPGLDELAYGEVGKDAEGYDAPANQWVKYVDVVELVNEAERLRERNVELHVEIDRLRGIVGGGTWVRLADVDHQKPNNQLLNELYHDRARLEKTLKLFASVATEALDSSEELLDRDYGDVNHQKVDQLLINVVTSAARLGALVDEHGGD